MRVPSRAGTYCDTRRLLVKRGVGVCAGSPCHQAASVMWSVMQNLLSVELCDVMRSVRRPSASSVVASTSGLVAAGGTSSLVWNRSKAVTRESTGTPKRFQSPPSPGHMAGPAVTVKPAGPRAA